MMQLLGVFQKQGYNITMASAASPSVYAEDLSSLGIKTQSIALNSPSFDVFISNLQPNVVLFDRFLTEEQFGWRVAEQVPNALRILETSDLHSLRHVREQCFKKGIEFTTEAWLQNDKTKRETASIYRCDLSLIISGFEMELLTKFIKIDQSLLLLLPFMIDEIMVTTDWPTFEQRTDFLFIGGGKHTPNVDAINYLRTDIWPLIHNQLPEVKLNVYGAYLPQQVLEMNNPKQGFLIQGRAADVQIIMQQSCVCLAPLRFGAGIKGKLLEAMRNGTPSVTTSIGAEGMQGILEWNGFVENHPQEFANAAVRLYTDKNRWQMAQEQGKTLINTLFNKKSLEKVFVAKLKEVQN